MKYLTTWAPLGLITTVILLLSACGGSESVVESAPTAIPAATATEVPIPTATPVPPTPVPTATTIPTPTPEPTATPVPPTPEPTATPVPPTPEPTEEQTAEPLDEEAASESTDDAGTEPADEPAPDEPAVDEAPTAADGAAIFAASCATCHGAGGAGTGRGPSIMGIGQFFTSDASPLVGLVTNGGTNMPSFAAELTTGEIDAVVQYVVATFQ